MADDNDDPDNYRVGKGRPPRATQFKRGQVANPNGRRGKGDLLKPPPEMKEQMGKIFRAILNSKVEANTAKGKRELTLWEVQMRQLANRATKSDAAMRELRNWLREFKELTEPIVRVSAIEHEVVHPNVFTSSRPPTVGHFRDAFPNAPKEDLDVLRRYLEEGYALSDYE